ncbi:MAG: cytochrome c3 family protein [Capsulimonadaceae bacterium]
MARNNNLVTIACIAASVLLGGMVAIRADDTANAPASATPNSAQAGADSTSNASPSSASPQTAPSATYVGVDACKTCHPDVYQPWSASPHGQIAETKGLPDSLKGCESCHGPGSAHTSLGSANKLPIPSSDDPANVIKICGACHLQQSTSQAPASWQNIPQADYLHSQHGRNGMSCLSCHTGHPNGNTAALIKPAPDLCLDCHGSVLESSPGKKAAYTHMPVASGLCLKCHDAHGGSNSSMVVDNIGAVCKTCHDTSDKSFSAAHYGQPAENSDCSECHDPHSHDKDKALMPANQHMPFQSRLCETCHTKPTTPGAEIGFIKPETELCFSCHPASTMMPDGDTAHPPVQAGMCVTCHNPHASTQNNLLRGRVANVCFTCHKQTEQDTLSPFKHPILESTMDCMLCHSPHSSPNKSLLVTDQQTLCSQCHKPSHSHPVFKKDNGDPVYVPGTKNILTCASCHDIHGGPFSDITKADQNRDLCLMCHAQDHLDTK